MAENENIVVPPSEVGKNVDEVFDAAVFIVQNMPKDGSLNITNSQKLQFYALFKQATLGSCNQPRPSMFNMVERYKWDAWNSYQNLDKTKAKEMYITNIQAIFDSVEGNLNWQEMVTPEKWKTLEPLIRPKLKLIGRGLSEEVEETPAADEQSTIVVSNSTTTEASVTDELSSVLSDDEFLDAFDVHHEDQSNPLIEQENVETPTPNALNVFVTHFENHISALTTQINLLNKSLLEQQSMVTNFMNRVNQARRRGVQRISWFMFIFLLLWPFFAPQLFRYFLRQFFSS